MPDEDARSIVEFSPAYPRTRGGTARALSADMQTKPFHSERPLPAVHAAILELHIVNIGLLASVQLRNSEIGQIRRATGRAAIAIEHATAGHRRRDNLRRAHEAMMTCHGLTQLLHLEGMIDARTYGLVRRRIDQIVSGLEQLGDTNAECWTTIELAPIEIGSSDSSSRTVDSRLRQLLLGAAEAIRSISQDWPPKIEEQVAPQHQGVS
jgi:hypothetical protein